MGKAYDFRRGGDVTEYKSLIKKKYPEATDRYLKVYQQAVKEFQSVYPDLKPPDSFLIEEYDEHNWGGYYPEILIISIWVDRFCCCPGYIPTVVLHELTHAYLHQQGKEHHSHGHLFWSTFKPLNKYLLAADKYRERFRQKMEELKNGQIDYTDRDLRVREINIPKQITRRGGNLSGRHS